MLLATPPCSSPESGVCLGPHHKLLQEERMGPAELRAQHLHTESLIITSDSAQNKNFLWKFTSVFANNDWAPFHKTAATAPLLRVLLCVLASGHQAPVRHSDPAMLSPEVCTSFIRILCRASS